MPRCIKCAGFPHPVATESSQAAAPVVDRDYGHYAIRGPHDTNLSNMKIEQRILSATGNWTLVAGALDEVRAQFALVFGDRARLEDPTTLNQLRAIYPGAQLILGSTSGEITGSTASEAGVTATAVALEKSTFACAAFTVRSQYESREAGQELAGRLNATNLVHVFVVSDGQLVNGTELSRGFNERLAPGVALTGGLAGDGVNFERTVVGLDQPPTIGRIVAIGFYGRHLHVGFGSCGGWEAIGDERVVTRASGNILFALDGQPALRLYQEYLGDQAADLPASALRFPLCVAPPDGSAKVVRTILSVEEVTQSMVFAGDIPTGSRVRFMRATHDNLVGGAARAAADALLDASAELALCVSCVGRRIVLGARTSDETECVRKILGPTPVLAGFYSYGELAPAGANVGCQLHNQTMTITTLREG